MIPCSDYRLTLVVGDSHWAHESFDNGIAMIWSQERRVSLNDITYPVSVTPESIVLLPWLGC